MVPEAPGFRALVLKPYVPVKEQTERPAQRMSSTMLGRSSRRGTGVDAVLKLASGRLKRSGILNWLSLVAVLLCLQKPIKQPVE